MRSGRWKSVAFAVAMAASGGSFANDLLGLDRSDFHALDSMERVAEGRPNEEARLAAMKAYTQGHYGRALQHFERAAHYADKYSQHSLSLMHWHGIGTPVNRVEAYIWADLAAERGTRRLLLVREKMWSELTETERAQARNTGPSYYERYGDHVAQPRAESAMRLFATRMTGSRVGYDGRAIAIGGKPTIGTFGQQVSQTSAFINSFAATPVQLYGGNRRDTSAYWAEQDLLLGGRVDVGLPSTVRDRAN